MGAIANYQPFFNHTFKGYEHYLKNPFAGQEALSATELSRVSVMDQKSVEIKLMTAEGDRITLSVNALFEESYTGYNSRGYMNGMVTGTRMETFSSFSDRWMSITLEGDLNEEELVDIQRVLAKVESLASDFFRGEIDEAVAKAIQFDDMGSVVNLKANLEYTYSMSIEQQYMAKMTGIPSELPETVTEKKTPINGRIIRTLINEMTEAIGKSKVKPAKMAKMLPKFIDHLFDNHVVKDDPDGWKQDVAKRIKAEFLKALARRNNTGQTNRW